MDAPVNRAGSPPLADRDARCRSLHDHTHSLLVEAGAGTGKTTLLAGRIAMLLASGVAPRQIAAITFTEKAAAELKLRVTRYTRQLADGKPPAELAQLLDGPLSPDQTARLKRGLDGLAELTVSTIHAFCQQLIRPYPVEAAIDPGASVLDANHGAIARERLLQVFLLEALRQPEAFPYLTALFRHDASGALRRLASMADARAARREAAPHHTDAAPLGGELQALSAATDALRDWQAARSAEGLALAPAQTLAESWTNATETYRTALASGAPADALVTLALAPPAALPLTKNSTPLVWQLKGKWQALVKAIRGGTKVAADREGGELSDAGKQLHERTSECWLALQERISALAAQRLMDELQGFLEHYAFHKAGRAEIDFEDLLLTARRLLATQPAVRTALAARYQHVLVDEFQDTDPLQVAILWLLCGDGDPAADWRAQTLRPGALFCVGDPKQAIYRFRGADINTYQAARDAIAQAPLGDRLFITTNFRSDEPVIRWVNETFAGPLAAEGQPGFIPLVAKTPPLADAPGLHVRSYVLSSDGPVREDDEKAQDALREQEAATVAALCRQLIGQLAIEEQDVTRPLAPRDIALLTQTGTELWRYERALEAQGIPIVSQAGKGFFHRQEVQDLINLTRVLAEPRDTLALGAFLRGPCVGLSDQTLLDITLALASGAQSVRKPVLRLWTPLDAIEHPLAREVLDKLQTLARRARRTTPYLLLAEAVDALAVRAVLLNRHPASPERALGNVDRLLELARPWDSAGLRAFSHYLRARWEDADAEVEARADLHENAVHLITAHSAKGLEWPVVVLINSFSKTNNRADPVLLDRATQALIAKLGPVPSQAYTALKEHEKQELAHERVRLLYVACTRAKHLLLLPQLDPKTDSWFRKAGVSVAAETALEQREDARWPLPNWAGELPITPEATASANTQTAADFVTESELVAARTPQLSWHRPSLHEGTEALADPPLFELDLPEELPAAEVVGGTERGNTLHLLMEELIAGLLAPTPEAIAERVQSLIAQADPAQPLEAKELVRTVCRTLALPEVAHAWPRLQAEFTTFASELLDGQEILTRGIADALMVDEQGHITAVFDWKSDVAPTSEVKSRYVEQVRDYLRASGATQGFVVYMTAGEIDVVSLERKA